MSKQISKDNREYWLKKLSDKFSDEKTSNRFITSS